MKDFSKGFNGVSADMIKAAADIAKQSARTANEAKQQDAAKMAARYESVRPATNVESGSRPVERMYASMKPTHLNPVGETIASRVAALSEGATIVTPKPMKAVTKHETLPHDSYLLEPKVKMAKPLKKIPADEAVLTDEDKAKLAEILASIEEKKLDAVGKEDHDVNNDGKTNSTDSYLKNRRKAISANIKEDETVEEGWDDMVKSAKDTLKDKPKPNGGAGMKQGTRYGGGKQKDGEEKKEKEEANEGAMVDKIKSFAKKALEKAGGGTDADQLKRLQKNMGVAQTGKKPEMKEEVEQLDELSPTTLGSYVKKATSDVRMNTNMARNTTGSQSDKFAAKAWKREDNVGKAVDRITKPAMKEEKDTPGQEHVCAVHVKHAKLGEGKTLFSQHAEPAADGSIAWYDVMFAEGIERVETKDLEIIEAMSHGNHKKK